MIPTGTPTITAMLFCFWSSPSGLASTLIGEVVVVSFAAVSLSVVELKACVVIGAVILVSDAVVKFWFVVDDTAFSVVTLPVVVDLRSCFVVSVVGSSVSATVSLVVVALVVVARLVSSVDLTV